MREATTGAKASMDEDKAEWLAANEDDVASSNTHISSLTCLPLYLSMFINASATVFFSPVTRTVEDKASS